MIKADTTQRRCFVACDEQTKKDGRCTCLTNKPEIGNLAKPLLAEVRLNKVETYKGIDIYEKADLVGGKYYISPDLTTKKVPVNFTPSIRLMKKFIDEETES